MNRIYLQFSILAAAILIAAAIPARAQTTSTCTTSQSMAAKCFVDNALSTKILALPSGITQTQYESFGVASLRILQSGPTAVTIVGAMSAVADAMPQTNADGSANASAQIAAVNAIISSAVSRGIIALPTQTTLTQLQWFAQGFAATADPSNAISFSPGGVLRLIDSYIITSTDSNGNVNWTTVDSGISTAIGNLVTSGLIKLPSGITVSQLDLFAADTAQAIAAYKTATGRKSL
jgi:hypothetical protein